MSTQEETKPTVTIGQQSAVSIGLAIIIGGYIIWNSIQLTVLQSGYTQMTKELSEIKTISINKEQFNLTLQIIDTRLKNIEDAIVEKKKYNN